MINSLNRQRRPGRTAQNETTHHFVVGQIVRLTSGRNMKSTGSDDTYQITALLPSAGEYPQYRIRSEQECHERVTTQDNLEPIAVRAEDPNASLIAKTFGHR